MLMRIPAIVVLAVVMVGCAKQIQPATKHAAITPDQVKLYQKAPTRYEQLGLLRVVTGGEVKWDKSGEANAGFDQFMAKAAAMGANGVLFVVPAGTSDVQATVGYKGTFYAVPMKVGATREALAEAIYVLKP